MNIFASYGKGKQWPLPFKFYLLLRQRPKRRPLFLNLLLKSILQGCLRVGKNLNYAMQIHVILLRNGLLFTDDCMLEELICLFALWKISLASTNQVISTLPDSRGLYSWNAIISSSVNYGKEELALWLYDQMSSHHVSQLDKITYVCVFQAWDVASIDISKFCYHPRHSITGNCQMCLVGIMGEKMSERARRMIISAILSWWCHG